MLQIQEPTLEQQQSELAREHKLRLAVSIYAITVIAGLEIYALSQHIDGFGLSLALVGLSGLGGYSIRDVVRLIQR